MVEKIGDALRRLGRNSGTLRHPAAVGDSTSSVGSGRSRSRALGAPETSRSNDGMEALRVLNALSEAAILEGYGVCGRCGGTGFLAFDDDAHRYRECRRCDGTGRKGG